MSNNILNIIQSCIPENKRTNGSFMANGSAYVQIYTNEFDRILSEQGWVLSEEADDEMPATWRFTSPHSPAIAFALQQLGENAIRYEIQADGIAVIWLHGAYEDAVVEPFERTGWKVGTVDYENGRRYILTKR